MSWRQQLLGDNGRWIALLTVFIIALYFRLTYVTTAVVYEPIRGDAGQYYSCAWNLVHHGVYSMTPPGSENPVADSFRDPALPVIVALWIWLAPDDDLWYGEFLVGQAILGAMTVLLITVLARRALPFKAALVAGLLTALWPHCIVETGFVLTETLTGFLLTFGLLILSRASATGSFALSGALFALASLSNSIFVLLAPILAMVLYLKKQVSARSAFIFVTAALCLPLAWAARNANLPHTSELSSRDRMMMNLIEGSHPDYLNRYQKARVNLDPAAIEQLDEVTAEQDAALQSPIQGLQGMFLRFAGSPLQYLRWYGFDKPKMLWGWQLPTGQGDLYQYPTMHSPFVDRAPWRALISLAKASNYLWMLLMLSALPSIASANTRPPASDDGRFQQRVLVGAGVLVCYTTLFYTVLQAEPRYVIAIRGIEFLLAIQAIHQLIQFILKHRKPTGMPI